MTLIRDVLAELLSMFLADARMTVAILLLVAGVAALLKFTMLSPAGIGGFFLVGCLAIVVEATVRETRNRKS